MEHSEVLKIVKAWLKNRHPPPRRVSEGSNADLLVITTHFGETSSATYHLQVECKRTAVSVDVAIGQCLRYYADFAGLFTYLAIPEDFKMFKELQDIFGMVALPIGLIIVHNNGAVEIIKEAEGKERTLQIR